MVAYSAVNRQRTSAYPHIVGAMSTGVRRGAAILDDLHARGLIQDTTDEPGLRRRLDAGPVTVYCGFDPTADSLHVGNLVPLLVLRRFQDFGHRPIALAGGATGMVGDPSGRSDERNLLDAATLDRNLAAIKQQLAKLLDIGGVALLADNRDWLSPVTVLEFLRDVGKHVTVNTMLGKESIKSRLDGEHGISYTEFSYMLLQANDFFALHRDWGCEMQIGGSDQWGNITAGIDMVRRRSQATAYGLTVPLVTRADGTKFGKTADGAVWLSAKRTLPYEFHQYFLRTDDRDVERNMLQFTLLPVADVADLMERHRQAPEERIAQRALADSVTELIHGSAEVRRATLAAAVLFGGLARGESGLAGESLEALRGIVPETEIAATVLTTDEPAVDLLVATRVCSSRSDARRTIVQGGIRINGNKLEATTAPVDPVDGRFVLVQRGKKQRHLAVLGP